MLEGDKPLTIFAPTDEAFAALPRGSAGSLPKPENADKPRGILAYHAVRDGLLKANDSTIRSTDIECRNGVINVLDAVLFPPAGKGQAAKPPRMDPLERIEAPIDKGVPAYNGGAPGKCARITKIA